jgi:N6-L-threonylcarbamoyladenine synthase
VGLTFAKAFAWSRSLPFIAIDHMLAHLYASQLELPGGAPETKPGGASKTDAGPGNAAAGSPPPEYPFLGLLVSGGHSIICRADNFDDITVLGTTIDDAVGEAFDKVSKHYGFGYPGGAVIDRMAQTGDSEAFRFPLPSLHKGEHRCDMSYSGLKTAVINQLEQFRGKRNPPGTEPRKEDIAASFQKAAVDILLRALFNAAEDTGLKTVVAGGGVAANSYLRARLAERKDIRCLFPPAELCGDNGAMIAGIGYQYLARGETSPFSVNASARVSGFKRRYP